MLSAIPLQRRANLKIFIKMAFVWQADQMIKTRSPHLIDGISIESSRQLSGYFTIANEKILALAWRDTRQESVYVWKQWKSKIMMWKGNIRAFQKFVTSLKHRHNATKMVAKSVLVSVTRSDSSSKTWWWCWRSLYCRDADIVLNL